MGEPAVDALPNSYEVALAELEALIRQMEGGSLNLEASITAYRRGVSLVTYCRQQLEKVEQQVRVLDGEMLKPLETNHLSSGA
ncbi:exodeoxyribonuclease VII small subunit [Mycoavidus sp. B2-EB]|uniref:exodeoxyribonuclease VII small subunit n=1 Tax=Mycoavidus sp. B2-EB TaxID=2651972 RepID=UPI0016272633|nr:exodeoxyribonuclease VII small subunit [Mycoavidus sp. B2-EB]